jgi:flagellar FliL protein
MAEENKDGQAQKPARNIGAILQMVAAVIILGCTSGGAYMVYASTIGWENPKITEEALSREIASMTPSVKEPFIYTMDKFTVNLGGEPKRTIRIEVNLEMLGKEGFEEVINVENRAKARDGIVRILNDKSFSELESIQGKLFLKQSIAMEVNSLLKKGIVKDVFFSEFVVQ